ncbi:hypothetical protein BDW66DRAFT_161716 [Aspergillus desertorum]
MSDYPASTVYVQRHMYNKPWQHKDTSLSHTAKGCDVDADADDDADVDAEYELEGQPYPVASAFEEPRAGEELDFNVANAGEADNGLDPLMDRDGQDLSDPVARREQFEQYRFKPPASLNPGHGQASNVQASGNDGLQAAYYSGNIGESDLRASNVQGLGRRSQTKGHGRYFSASPAEETDDFGDEYDPESLDVGAGGGERRKEEWSERD